MTQVQNDLYTNLADYKHQVSKMKVERDKMEKEFAVRLSNREWKIKSLKKSM